MAQQAYSSDRVWPESGLWAASYRVMFPLAALWAVVCVAFWQWAPGWLANLPAPLMWHVHEMTFGFGGAAVAGYLLTACSSWTGRAPVSGRPLWGLVMLWLAARAAALLAGVVPVWLCVVPAVGFFWWIAGLLATEARRAGRGRRPFFLLFCALAGPGSGGVLVAMAGGDSSMALWPVAGFVFLLVFVGGRMVPAFLQNAAQRQGLPFRPITSGEHVAILILLAAGFAALFMAEAWLAPLLLGCAGLGLLWQACRWPMRPVSGDGLLAMMPIAFLWLPAGLLLWAGLFVAPDLSRAAAPHALMMGGMGGLIFGVSARAFARRTDKGLRAPPGLFPAFLLVMASVVLRLAGLPEPAAVLWCAGWGGYFCLMLPHMSGPVPRPVFSGARNT